MAETRTQKRKKKIPAAKHSMLEDENVQPLPDDFPVMPDVAPQMKIDVVVNRENEVWVIYDRPFPALVEWVEYDADTGDMTFVTTGGKIQDLGMKIHPPMDKYVRNAREVCLMRITDGKICDMGMVKMTVRDYGL